MFTINDINDIDSIKEMANRAYALLQKGDSTFTCGLTFGNEFVAYCENSKIYFRMSDKMTSQINIIDHEREIVQDAHTTTAVFHFYNNTADTRTKLCTLSGERIVRALLFGVQEINTVQDIRIIKYIMTNRKQFEKDDLLLPFFVKFRPREIFLKNKLEEAHPFFESWNQFIQSKIFTVVKVILAISVALLGIFDIIKLGKKLYNIL